MPRLQLERSETTGELLDAQTLELAADVHNIDIAETSVGRMFNLTSNKKKAEVKKTASIQEKQNNKVASYTQRRRGKFSK